MSDFDDGLVIGLVIGKKKFKGGKKYDSVYHDILENIVPIIEHYDLGGGFTWTIGEWMSDIGIGGGRYETYMNGVMSSNTGVNTKERSCMQLNTFRREIYLVGIIYKDSDPMYAAVIGEASNYGVWDQWNNWGIREDEGDRVYYRSVIYKQRGDYSIDEISNVTYTKLEPKLYKRTVKYTDGETVEMIAGFDMYFNSDITYTRTKSWQEYIASSPDNYTEPTVKKDGGRKSETFNYSLSDRDLYPFPRIYGGYSDLDNDKWFDIMQELSYAIIEKAGGKTEPLKIIQPTE